ncbi:hypothetical protein Peur_013309 [Populus x canadensis]
MQRRSVSMALIFRGHIPSIRRSSVSKALVLKGYIQLPSDGGLEPPDFHNHGLQLSQMCQLSRQCVWIIRDFCLQVIFLILRLFKCIPISFYFDIFFKVDRIPPSKLDIWREIRTPVVLGRIHSVQQGHCKFKLHKDGHTFVLEMYLEN